MVEGPPAADPALALALAQVPARPSGHSAVEQAARDQLHARKEPARPPTSTTANVLPKGADASLAKQALSRHNSCFSGPEGDDWLDILHSCIYTWIEHSQSCIINLKDVYCAS